VLWRGTDKMYADVILHQFPHQTVDRAAGTGDELQNIGAADFLLQRPLTASTCPRMRRTRLRSLVFSRMV